MSTTQPPIPILLLKTRSQPTDNYCEYFSTPTPTSPTTFLPTFIPVLSHQTNLSPILTYLQYLTSPSPSYPPYGGLIFTSQRAVEAFSSALTHPSTPSPLPSLSLPVYCVGPATSAAISTILTTHLPSCTPLGSHTGNGEDLAHFILQHYPTQPSSSSPNLTTTSSPHHFNPLLFFVGEKRRDIIPNTLQSPSLPPNQRIRVDEQVVYETKVEDGFEEEFGRELLRVSTDGGQGMGLVKAEGRQIWIVVFSPTGCEGMLKVLGWSAERREWMEGSTGASGRVKVASIGPTTRDYLRDRFGFESDVCAERPSPEGVREGIERVLREERGV